MAGSQGAGDLGMGGKAKSQVNVIGLNHGQGQGQQAGVFSDVVQSRLPCLFTRTGKHKPEIDGVFTLVVVIHGGQGVDPICNFVQILGWDMHAH